MHKKQKPSPFHSIQLNFYIEPAKRERQGKRSNIMTAKLSCTNTHKTTPCIMHKVHKGKQQDEHKKSEMRT